MAADGPWPGLDYPRIAATAAVYNSSKKTPYFYYSYIQLCFVFACNAKGILTCSLGPESKLPANCSNLITGECPPDLKHIIALIPPLCVVRHLVFFERKLNLIYPDVSQEAPPPTCCPWSALAAFPPADGALRNPLSHVKMTSSETPHK